MTLTITSAEELRQAIEHPENYRGLRVRMGVGQRISPS